MGMAIAFGLWSALVAFLGLTASQRCDEEAFGCGRRGYGPQTTGSRVGPFMARAMNLGRESTTCFRRHFYVGLVGLAVASAFVAFVVLGRRALAGAALLASLVLLSYPYFAALTSSIFAGYLAGCVLGAAGLVTMRRRAT